MGEYLNEDISPAENGSPNKPGKFSLLFDKIAGVVTVLFHPVFLPLYGLYLLFSIPELLVFLPGTVRRVIFLLVLSNNVIMPLALLPLFKVRNIIASYRLETRAERILPLLSTSLLYFITAFMVFRFQLPGVIKAFLFSGACVVFATALVNFRWKVSVHSVGAGAMVATVLLLSFKMYTGQIWVVSVVFLFAGLIMASRLFLSAHTPGQVYSGFILGAVVMALGMGI